MAGNLNIDIRNCHRAKIAVFRSFGHSVALLNPVLSPNVVENVSEQIHVNVFYVVL
jgi:translation initiation factor 6 (eIF-6)